MIACSMTFFVSSFIQAIFEYFIYIAYVVGMDVLKGKGDDNEEQDFEIIKEEYEDYQD